MKFLETSAILLATASSVAAAAFGPPQRPTFSAYKSSTTTTTTKSTTTSKATSSTTLSTTTTTSTTTTPISSPTPSSLCLTNSTAAYLVNGYASLLTAYTNATAEALLSSDFSDTSDSINWLAGIPLGSATFATKADFEAGQGTQPAIGFTVDHMFYSCSEVAFRWTATVAYQTWPVKGINMFTATNLNNSASGWQVQSMYSEFDVGAWEVDIGRTCSPQGANV